MLGICAAPDKRDTLWGVAERGEEVVLEKVFHPKGEVWIYCQRVGYIKFTYAAKLGGYTQCEYERVK